MHIAPVIANFDWVVIWVVRKVHTIDSDYSTSKVRTLLRRNSGHLTSYSQSEWGFVNSTNSLTDKEDIIIATVSAWEFDLKGLIGIIDTHNVESPLEVRIVSASQRCIKLIG